MHRRVFTTMLGGLMAASVLPRKPTVLAAPPTVASADPFHMSVPPGPPQQIAMLIHPGCIPLDVFGPHAVFAMLDNVQVHLVWKTRAAVVAATGVSLQPTTTLAECPPELTVLFVPGDLLRFAVACTRQLSLGNMAMAPG